MRRVVKFIRAKPLPVTTRFLHHRADRGCGCRRHADDSSAKLIPPRSVEERSAGDV
jgi:hypothetical protein